MKIWDGSLLRMHLTNRPLSFAGRMPSGREATAATSSFISFFSAALSIRWRSISPRTLPSLVLSCEIDIFIFYLPASIAERLLYDRPLPPAPHRYVPVSPASIRPPSTEWCAGRRTGASGFLMIARGGASTGFESSVWGSGDTHFVPTTVPGAGQSPTMDACRPAVAFGLFTRRSPINA